MRRFGLLILILFLITPIAPADQVDRLLKDFEKSFASEETAERIAALQLLADQPDERVAKVVGKALDDESQEVQEEAIAVLGALAIDAGVGPLRDLLKDAEASIYVKGLVLEALGDIATPRALQAIIDDHPGHKDERLIPPKIRALGRIRLRMSVGWLIVIYGSLEGESLRYEQQVVLALENLTEQDLGLDKESWQDWWKANESNFYFQEEVPKMLTALDRALKEELDPEKAQGAIYSMIPYKEPEVIKRLTEVMLAGRLPEHRSAAAYTLGAMQDPRCYEPLKKAYAINRKKPDELLGVLYGLGALGDVRGVKLMTKSWWTPMDWKVVWTKIAALGLIRHADSVNALINFLYSTDKDRIDEVKVPVRRTLRSLTGQDHGFDRVAWKNWWVKNRKSFEVKPMKGKREAWWQKVGED